MVSTIVIGPGRVNFSAVVWAGEPGLGLVYAPLQRQRPDHLRHHRLVAIVANAHFHLVLEVDAAHRLEKAVHEMLARLLAVADDVEPRVLLHLQPKQGGVALGCSEFRSLRLPLRPQLVRFRQPGGFRQAAGDRRFEHRHLRPVSTGS
jgi:hypothetical protein